MNKTNKQYALKSFISNVHKLTPGRSVTSDLFGRVTCISAADHSKGRVIALRRTGYGTRKFSLSKSPVAPSGKYTITKLVQKLEAAI